MVDEIFLEIHKDLPREGPGRNKYTRKAFHMLPSIKNPKILDIGCGPGDQTIELAKISNGKIIGIDIYKQYLDDLNSKIIKQNLETKIKVMKQSMFEMDFLKESFDIIWAEGSIYIIGFEKGLIEWNKFIKPDGFLVVHEMTWLQDNPPDKIFNYWRKMYPGITTIEKNIQIIKKCKYDLINHFPLPEDAWWDLYYTPLENRLNLLRKKYENNPHALKTINAEQEEIDLFRRYNKWYGSVFYIMQKKL